MTRLVKCLCFGAGCAGTVIAGSVSLLAKQREEAVDLLLNELVALKNQESRQKWIVDQFKAGGLQDEFKINDNNFVDREKAKVALRNWCSTNLKETTLSKKYCY